MSDTATIQDGKIICEIDGARVHSIPNYLKSNHPTVSIDDYRSRYPNAPILSEFAKERLRQISEDRKRESSMPSKIAEAVASASSVAKRAMHELFDLGNAKAALNSRGGPVMITTFSEVDEDVASYIPEIDKAFVYDIATLKSFLIGFEFGIPMLAWGFHGTGKTSLFEQISARTGRPFIRVQHTANTEESHIVGQYVVRDGQTEWQNGPLVTAMIHGGVYCADEYDFAMPSVTAVYQPVLEGKPLVIKEAPPEFRVVRPHPDFRFTATGNTNGAGDETGLYQGTQIQNAANFSRFGVTEEIKYMPPKVESAIIQSKGGVTKEIADKFVEFATAVREAFANGKIGMTVSPRELIVSARLGYFRGNEWRVGLNSGFANRLSRVDRVVVDQFAQRIFG